jgi:hypothetical protein
MLPFMYLQKNLCVPCPHCFGICLCDCLRFQFNVWLNHVLCLKFKLWWSCQIFVFACLSSSTMCLKYAWSLKSDEVVNLCLYWQVYHLLQWARSFLACNWIPLLRCVIKFRFCLSCICQILVLCFMMGSIFLIAISLWLHFNLTLPTHEWQLGCYWKFKIVPYF